jgi:hypothetical protein
MTYDGLHSILGLVRERYTPRYTKEAETSQFIFPTISLKSFFTSRNFQETYAFNIVKQEHGVP